MYNGRYVGSDGCKNTHVRKLLHGATSNGGKWVIYFIFTHGYFFEKIGHCPTITRWK